MNMHVFVSRANATIDLHGIAFVILNIHVFACLLALALARSQSFDGIQFIFRLNTCEVLFSFVALNVLVRTREIAYTV